MTTSLPQVTPAPTPLTLDALNTAPVEAALQWLDGLYEHSPWIAEAALAQRPFRSLAHLKFAMVQALREAGIEAQLALIRAHPELAGKAMVAKSLTAESTNEQSKAGLTACTPEEFEKLQTLNAAYNAKFGFPFIVAVRGPRGLGYTRQQIIATFERRLSNPLEVERETALHNIHRIAEIRLNDKFGVQPEAGHRVWDWHEQLAVHSEPGYLEQGQLTVTYLSDAHRACALQLQCLMRDCGFDEAGIDAVGNVVGVYHGADRLAPRLLTGSHYDTVRNAGKYDGRLGIFVPIAAVQQLAQRGERLPFGIEVVAFSEEEGQRFPATFLGSSALVGQFDSAWLDQCDAQGVRLREAMSHAGLNPANVSKLARDPQQYLGFVEVHIEQGPVLHDLDLPLGVVTSINGSVRLVCHMTGVACHAGTTPMDRRRDAALGVAELALFVERRAAADGDSVGTVGVLQVPQGSINVVPGRCDFTLDLRAPTNAQRDALLADVLTEMTAIAQRRGLQATHRESMRASAAPSHPDWQARWERAVAATGLPVHRLPSGAGHDAMKLHERFPQAMLFVRGDNGGISHNPLESTTSDDMDLALQAFEHLLRDLAS